MVTGLDGCKTVKVEDPVDLGQHLSLVNRDTCNHVAIAFS